MDVDYNRFINELSARRKPSEISEIQSILRTGNREGVLSLGEGQPNVETFPFSAVKICIEDGVSFEIEGKDLERALQYSPTKGIPEMLKVINDLHAHYHNPPIMALDHPVGFGACVTLGSKHGLSMVFDMLLSPNDNLIVEEFTYCGVTGYVEAMPVNLIPIKIDHHGMQPDSLKEALSRWKPEDALDPNSDIPKVIYTIPNFQNPTGASLSEERKREIYEIARLYNLIIVEDDPYFLLNFGENIVPSYQSIDVDGRVIRGDSVSKILTSGLRVGWITGAKVFIERIRIHQGATVMHNSSLSQILIAKLFEHWKIEGFQKHIAKTTHFYKSRRDAILFSANKWLQGLAEWNTPEGGIFLWIKLLGIEDSSEVIRKKALEKGVLLIPSSCFNMVPNRKTSYCRACYSQLNANEMDTAIQRLADIIRSEVKQGEEEK